MRALQIKDLRVSDMITDIWNGLSEESRIIITQWADEKLYTESEHGKKEGE